MSAIESISVNDYFERHYRPRKLSGRSPETSRLYRISIRNFSRTLGRDAQLSDLTNDNVLFHMQRMLDDGRAKSTANKDRAQLLTIWRHAFRLGKHDTWPEVPSLIEPVRVPQAWLIEEIRQLLAAIETLDEDIAGMPARLWWKAMILICLDTGERIGAVRSVKWEWLSSNWLKMPAEVRKGGKQDRLYQLGDACMATLGELRKHTEDEMFPWPYCDNYIWTKFAVILRKAGLPDGRRDKFHRLRRTVASVVHKAGMDATEALDHSHRKTTKDSYLDPRYAREASVSKHMGEFLD